MELVSTVSIIPLESTYGKSIVSINTFDVVYILNCGNLYPVMKFSIGFTLLNK
jgi:hypothetical protein